MTKKPDIEPAELQRRVIYSLLRPAVRLARRFGVGLKEMKEWVELAYYHQLKEEGLTLDEAADAAQVSRRKVAQLAKRLKINFFSPEHEAGLPRRIEFMLWAAPLTAGRIRQALGVEDDEVQDALRRLVREERVTQSDDRNPVYSVPRSEFRLYANNWIARVDGLNNQLGSLTNTVFGRFFKQDDRAFQRTLDLRVRPQDIAQLERLYEDDIFKRLVELDEAARDCEESIPMGLSIQWAPDYEKEEKV